jgi:hypothetical protein
VAPSRFALVRTCWHSWPAPLGNWCRNPLGRNRLAAAKTSNGAETKTRKPLSSPSNGSKVRSEEIQTVGRRVRRGDGETTRPSVRYGQAGRSFVRSRLWLPRHLWPSLWAQAALHPRASRGDRFSAVCTCFSSSRRLGLFASSGSRSRTLFFSGSVSVVIFFVHAHPRNGDPRLPTCL